MSARGALLATLVSLSAGCSSIPSGRSLDELAPAPERLRLSVRIALPSVERGKGERLKDYPLERVLAADALGGEVARWLRASDLFTRVRVSSASGAGLAEAWTERDDLLLELSLREVETHFDGHNGWWLPNVVVWWLFMVPAWFVATEEYSLSFGYEWRLRSVDSGRVVARGRGKRRVTGTFGEFDRGWQFFGFLYPRNEGANWRAVAERLFPAARAEAGLAVARELKAAFAARRHRVELDRRVQKTMALVVGVSRYADSLHLAPLPYAASDAEAIAAALKQGAGLGERHVTLLTDQDATRAGVTQALQALAARTRPEDQVVVYFAGYGARGARGPGLVLGEATRLGDGRLRLDELATLLNRVRGRKLVLLDCSFDGLGRSLPSAGGPFDLPGALVVLTRANAVTLVAGSAGDHLVTPEPARGSLFAFHLARGIRGDADRARSGGVTSSELFSLVRKHVVADAAYYGKRQRPLAAGLEQPFRLSVSPGEGGGR